MIKIKLRDDRIRLTSYLWPGLLVILILLQIFFPYRGWLMLLFGLGGIFLLSFAWARALANQLRLIREMRFGWAQVGDILEERFQLVNTSRWPAIWVDVIDHSTIPDYSVGRATGVGGGATNAWQTRQGCTRRGLFTLGPTDIQTSDPFGLFTVTLQNLASTSLLVIPPILPLPSIAVAPGGRTGEGRPSSRAIEQSVNSSGIRDYIPGDSMRWIHWPTTAKKDDFYVKTFDNTPTSDWWIYLDLDESVQIGEGQFSTEETGVILAASLADRGLRAGVPVGMVSNSREPLWLPPSLSDLQRVDIMRSLAKAEPGPIPLVELLSNARTAIRRQASLIVITPCADIRWIEALLPMKWRGIAPTILLLDPKAFGGELTMQPLEAILSDHHIAHYTITPDLVDRPELHPKRADIWDWRVMPTGKVIAVHEPEDMTWKAIT